MDMIQALEALKNGKKVRRKKWDDKNKYAYYEEGRLTVNTSCSTFFANGVNIDEISELTDDNWEVVEEKPNKQTQYKIDSMKFQIVRYCTGRIANFESNCKECKVFKICEKNYNKHTETSSFGMLDDWSLKEIVEAYHILEEADEI